MPTAAGAAGITALGNIIGGATAPSPTAGSSINLTSKGASQYLNDLISGKGLGVVGSGDVNNAFGVGNQSLQGNFQRALGSAGQGAGAQSAAYGGTNPYAWIQHAQSGVNNQFANQSGDMATQQAMALLQNLYKNQDLRTQLVGLGGQTGGGGENTSPYGKKATFGGFGNSSQSRGGFF